MEKFPGTDNKFGRVESGLVLTEQLVDRSLNMVQVHVELRGQLGERDTPPGTQTLVGTLSHQMLPSHVFLKSEMLISKVIE